ncbi:hypothetical protein LBMAG47_00420 [Planctomycetia bacterium]|nr:hypothetical protein LBMAG47_00410 [Planctomycetia bacterium]GDX94379.1 hypothetical protein LBMAG47_00420 [Planctomycetia bacterium]
MKIARWFESTRAYCVRLVGTMPAQHQAPDGAKAWRARRARPGVKIARWFESTRAYCVRLAGTMPAQHQAPDGAKPGEPGGRGRA